jgi:proline racemase
VNDNESGENDWARRVRAWSPPDSWRRVLVVDAHTEGEPLRVVIAGFPELVGEDVLARRRHARAHHDGVRRMLMWEPRGHADMYGCVVGPPVTPEADVAVLFTHNEGYSTMCGHGIIGLATVMVECGLVAATGPETRVGIDTPAGFVEAWATVVDGRAVGVRFVNVPSFVSRTGGSVDVKSVGRVAYDLAYGGAFYAYVDAASLGLRLVSSEAPRLIDLGSRIKTAVQAADPPRHPEHDDLGFVYGVIFTGEAHGTDAHLRNVCVFADGEIDRCPTGTGVSGRLALEHAEGRLSADEVIVIESIIGTRFGGRVTGQMRVGGLDAVIPEVSGRSWITGRSELVAAPDDPLREGFLVR